MWDSLAILAIEIIAFCVLLLPQLYVEAAFITDLPFGKYIYGKKKWNESFE